MEAAPHSIVESINNVKWLDYANNMLSTQRTIYQLSSMSDVTVVAGSSRCKAHQIVLSASSDYFRSVLAASCSSGAPAAAAASSADGSPSSHCCGEATIIIPDLNPDLLEPLMNFVYTGETFVSPTALSEFLEACNYLKIKGFLNYACMVNGIQLQKQQTQTHLPNQQPQPLVGLSLPVEPTAPQQPPMQTLTDDGDETTLAIYSIQDVGKFEPDYVIGTYVDGGDPSETVAEIETTSNDADAQTLTQMDPLEEYLDEDNDDEDVQNDPDLDNDQTLDEPPVSDEADEPADETAAEIPQTNKPVRVRRAAPKSRKKSTDSPKADAAATNRLSKSYSQATLNDALDELQSGSSVVDVAARFEIPRSTIYARLRCGRDRIYRQYHQTKLDDAVRGVIETGMSLKEASTRYDVSKTVLWRALKKSNVYKPEDRIQLSRADAMVAIQRGETLISISKAYNIPLATLHRDKVRLYREGKLPDHCKLRKRDVGPNYRIRLNAAVASCRNGMPQKIASELHGVPKTTIWRHLQWARRLEASGAVLADGETDGDGGDAELNEDAEEEELLEDYEEDEVMDTEVAPDEQDEKIVEEVTIETKYKVDENDDQEVDEANK